MQNYYFLHVDASLVKYANFNGSDLSFKADSMGFRLEFTKRLDKLKNTLVLLCLDAARIARIARTARTSYSDPSKHTQE